MICSREYTSGWPARLQQLTLKSKQTQNWRRFPTCTRHFLWFIFAVEEMNHYYEPLLIFYQYLIIHSLFLKQFASVFLDAYHLYKRTLQVHFPFNVRYIRRSEAATRGRGTPSPTTSRQPCRWTQGIKLSRDVYLNFLICRASPLPISFFCHFVF